MLIAKKIFLSIFVISISLALFAQPKLMPDGSVDPVSGELVLNEGSEDEIRVRVPSLSSGVVTPDATLNFDGSLDVDGLNEALPVPDFPEIVLLGDGSPQLFGNFGADSSGTQHGVFSDILLQHKSTGTIVVWFMQNVDDNNLPIDAVGITELPDWNLIPGSDFNNDGLADFVLQSKDLNVGTFAVWTMDKVTPTNGVGVAVLPGWNIRATGDFGQYAEEGEGNVDLVLQHTNGTIVVWFLDGTTSVGATGITVLADWDVVAAADFNNDDELDFLLQNNIGTLSVWYMNGLSPVSGEGIAELGNYRVKGVADYNVDGNNDLLLQSSDGTVVIWTMDGVVPIVGYGISVVPDWEVIGPR